MVCALQRRCLSGTDIDSYMIFFQHFFYNFFYRRPLHFTVILSRRSSFRPGPEGSQCAVRSADLRGGHLEPLRPRQTPGTETGAQERGGLVHGRL